eukprot:403353479
MDIQSDFILSPQSPTQYQQLQQTNLNFTKVPQVFFSVNNKISRNVVFSEKKKTNILDILSPKSKITKESDLQESQQINRNQHVTSTSVIIDKSNRHFIRNQSFERYSTIQIEGKLSERQGPNNQFEKYVLENIKQFQQKINSRNLSVNQHQSSKANLQTSSSQKYSFAHSQTKAAKQVPADQPYQTLEYSTSFKPIDTLIYSKQILPNGAQFSCSRSLSKLLDQIFHEKPSIRIFCKIYENRREETKMSSKLQNNIFVRICKHDGQIIQKVEDLQKNCKSLILLKAYQEYKQTFSKLEEITLQNSSLSGFLESMADLSQMSSSKIKQSNIDILESIQNTSRRNSAETQTNFSELQTPTPQNKPQLNIVQDDQFQTVQLDKLKNFQSRNYQNQNSFQENKNGIQNRRLMNRTSRQNKLINNSYIPNLIQMTSIQRKDLQMSPRLNINQSHLLSFNPSHNQNFELPLLNQTLKNIITQKTDIIKRIQIDKEQQSGRLSKAQQSYNGSNQCSS